MLQGKTVVLGVTGSIAAYKIASLASMLVKLHADVHVLMTENAANFINPITFETLTNHKCLVDTFDRNFNYNVEHVSLAKKADVLMIAPASANVIGKLAHGIADDMLTTTALACRCKKIISPAMNTNMYENPILQDNIETLKKYDMEVIEPDSGYLACGDTGSGKMPEPSVLLDYILKEIHYEKDMAGLKVLVTAGATREAIDPVRFISNHSTGKMGIAIARTAMERGAEVTLIAGNVTVPLPPFVNLKKVVSAKDMFEAVCQAAEEQDIIIKVAAVADFTPAHPASEKIKKTAVSNSNMLELTGTTDILKYLGEHRGKNQFLCGFSMETENMLENSRAKLERKKVDMIVANNLKTEGAGFGTDTNVVTMITKEEVRELVQMEKEKVAECLLDFIMEQRHRKTV
ncbi:MAG: bifunctional phosphopantothenoylcysteine decarboxylase/phosphopantothenate--cysteine ligase CoaBC [Lachnospiraceae bacterium]|nr:bifunctional phosphopantothenoylcysteine decarboxylase/phosphopantothenate--cysteine ligase CoaBC [Lachnospiraceae bacterium]